MISERQPIDLDTFLAERAWTAAPRVPGTEATREASLPPTESVGVPWVAPDQATLELREGDLFDGRFSVQVKLGQGGMGSVWEARDERLDREVALKIVLGSSRATRQSLIESLRAESKALASLAGQGVVAIHDVLERGEALVLVLERVRGLDLAECLEALREVDLPHRADWLHSILQEADKESPPADRPTGEWHEWVAGIGARLARSLAAAHERGVLHRDIKPSNVLLRPDLDAVLVDFGLAYRLSVPADGAAESFRGTFPYLAPEQITRRSTGTDPRIDVYQLALVLYEACALAPAYRMELAGGMEALFQSIVAGRHASLASLDPSGPRALHAVIERGLAASLDERYPDMASFAADLERVRDGLAPRGVRLPWRERTRLAARRVDRRAALALGLSGLLVAASPWIARGEAAGAPSLELLRFGAAGELEELRPSDRLVAGDSLVVRADGAPLETLLCLRVGEAFGERTIEWVEPRPLPTGAGELFAVGEVPGDVERCGLAVIASAGVEPRLEEFAGELRERAERAEPVPHRRLARFFERLEAGSRGPGAPPLDPALLEAAEAYLSDPSRGRIGRTSWLEIVCDVGR